MTRPTLRHVGTPCKGFDRTQVLVCCVWGQRVPIREGSSIRIVPSGVIEDRAMKRSNRLRILFGAALLAWPTWLQGAAVVSVTDHGAKGDGKTLDRSALNRAVEACAAAGGGQVRVAPGRYLTGTVRMRSGITLVLEAGAVLVGTPDLDQYESYAPPESRPGDRNHWHRALVLGVGVENVTITGPGVIDGNKIADLEGEEHMRGPHAVLFEDSRNIVLRDLHVNDAANYAVLLERTSHVEVPRGPVHRRVGWRALPGSQRSTLPGRPYHGLPVLYWRRQHCGRLLGRHGDHRLRDQFLMQRHPADRPGAELDRPRLPVLWARPLRAPHFAAAAPHQHAGRPLPSATARGRRRKGYSTT